MDKGASREGKGREGKSTQDFRGWKVEVRD